VYYIKNNNINKWHSTIYSKILFCVGSVIIFVTLFKIINTKLFIIDNIIQFFIITLFVTVPILIFIYNKYLRLIFAFFLLFLSLMIFSIFYWLPLFDRSMDTLYFIFYFVLGSLLLMWGYFLSTQWSLFFVPEEFIINYIDSHLINDIRHKFNPLIQKQTVRESKIFFINSTNSWIITIGMIKTHVRWNRSVIEIKTNKPLNINTKMIQNIIQEKYKIFQRNSIIK
jgi:hypothetical protein